MFAMQPVTKTLKPVRDRIAKAARQLKGSPDGRCSSRSTTRATACR